MTLRKDQDVELKQGDYKQLKVSVYNRLGQLIQLNTGTMQSNYQVRKSEYGRQALITKSLGNGITFDPIQTGSTLGILYIDIWPADSLSGTAGNLSGHMEGTYFHEANIVENGLPNVIFEGDFDVLVSVVQ